MRGRLRVPASKSVTQRYLALALVGRLSLRLEHPLEAEDPHLFQQALRACGFRVDESEGMVAIQPPAEAEPTERMVEIFCGNGGTMCRLLTGALTVVPGRFRLDGIPRLRERPIGPLVQALTDLDAGVRSVGEAGFPPLEITGQSLVGGRAQLDASASSQYLSALLIAGQAAREPLEIHVEALASSPYVDLTVDAIRDRGGRVDVDGPSRSYRTVPSELRGGDVEIEGDFSAAAYPAAAAALTGGRVTIDGLRRESAQGDRHLLHLLAEMGAEIVWQGDAVSVGASRRLSAITADMSGLPDQVPTIAALAPFAAGRTTISGVAHLRIKESDRLAAMACELQRLGVPVLERDDGLEIEGIWADRKPESAPVTVETYNDHRIAMALAVAGLRRPGVTIDSPRVVGKSYPRFWSDLEQLIA